MSYVLEMQNELSQLRAALDESVKLQSHYAGLLNAHDGGKRMEFADREAWMERLAELARLPKETEKQKVSKEAMDWATKQLEAGAHLSPIAQNRDGSPKTLRQLLDESKPQHRAIEP